MAKFGVIADDLTGACDVGIQFRKYGLDTIIIAETKALQRAKGYDVIVIDTESRNDPPDTAYSKTGNAAIAMKKMGLGLVYKKIDSTLRGNIGAELNSIMDRLNLKAAIIAPAFPASNRTTVDGKQLVNGIPLDKTEFAHDPINPVHESHIPTLVQRQTKRNVGTINLSKVRRGAEWLRHEIQDLTGSGKEILVADAETQDDLQVIAKAALDSDILACGSAGLAEGVSQWLASTHVKPRVLVVSGSLNAVTLDQISAVERKLNVQVFEPDILGVLTGDEKRRNEADRIFREASEAITRGRDIIITLARSKDKGLDIQRFSRELNMDYTEAAKEILSFLGEASRAIAENCRNFGLILVGGDTAIRVMNAMGAYGIKTEEEVLPGIPIGMILGGRSDGLLIITKAGGFGREDALIEAMKKLKEKFLAHHN